MISKEEGVKLLKLAKNSISTFFSDEEPSLEETKKFSEKQGVFVTLHKKGQLRGCIGFPEPTLPLNQAIADSARSAAFRDPRFPPVREDELKDIKLELSVLTFPEEIEVDEPQDYKKKIEIGKHGLIVRHPFGSGLLLPQVPIEQRWDIDEFLKHICIKAGLPPDTWMTREAKLYKFEAQIFSE